MLIINVPAAMVTTCELGDQSFGNVAGRLIQLPPHPHPTPPLCGLAGVKARSKQQASIGHQAASTKQQALRNWAFRFWQEAKKTSFLQTLISLWEISSLMRGVYPSVSQQGKKQTHPTSVRASPCCASIEPPLSHTGGNPKTGPIVCYRDSSKYSQTRWGG